MCLDSYLPEKDRIFIKDFRQVFDASTLRPALEYFCIPQGLWPPGLKMTSKDLDIDLREPTSAQIRELMLECVKVSVCEARFLVSGPYAFMHFLPERLNQAQNGASLPMQQAKGLFGNQIDAHAKRVQLASAEHNFQLFSNQRQICK